MLALTFGELDCIRAFSSGVQPPESDPCHGNDRAAHRRCEYRPVRDLPLAVDLVSDCSLKTLKRSAEVPA